MNRAEVLKVVFAAIDQFNARIPPCDGMSKTPETPLLGPGSSLDSLGLVALLVSVERELADRFGRELTLADENALSEEQSPFRTVATLVDYVVRRLEEPPRA